MEISSGPGQLESRIQEILIPNPSATIPLWTPLPYRELIRTAPGHALVLLLLHQQLKPYFEFIRHFVFAVRSQVRNKRLSAIDTILLHKIVHPRNLIEVFNTPFRSLTSTVSNIE